MKEPSSEHEELIAKLRDKKGDQFAELFSRHKERLRRIIRFRLDHRLASRISDSDVIQECYVRAAQRLPKYLDQPDYPFFVWLRLQTKQQIADIHRRHLVAEKRDARREVSLAPALESSNQTSVHLAAHLIGQMTTPSRLFERSEEIAALEQSLEEMNELDREVVALRHFEELSSSETAQVLGIEPAAASKRYVRALKRLQAIMAQHGFSRENQEP